MNDLTEKNFDKQNHKKIWINSIMFSIFIVCIIANIVMVTADVFHGTYSGITSDNTKLEITFYNNTFTQKVYRNGDLQDNKFGFYSSTEYNNEQYINLSFTNTSYVESYKRKNVFILEYKESLFHCSTAIFLQVLYGIDYLISLLVFFLYNKKFWKNFFSLE